MPRDCTKQTPPSSGQLISQSSRSRTAVPDQPRYCFSILIDVPNGWLLINGILGRCHEITSKVLRLPAPLCAAMKESTANSKSVVIRPTFRYTHGDDWIIIYWSHGHPFCWFMIWFRSWIMIVMVVQTISRSLSLSLDAVSFSLIMIWFKFRFTFPPSVQSFCACHIMSDHDEVEAGPQLWQPIVAAPERQCKFNNSPETTPMPTTVQTDRL